MALEAMREHDDVLGLDHRRLLSASLTSLNNSLLSVLGLSRKAAEELLAWLALEAMQGCTQRKHALGLDRLLRDVLTSVSNNLLLPVFGRLRMAALLAWQAWEVMREHALGLGRLRMLTMSISNLVAAIMLLQPPSCCCPRHLISLVMIITLLKRMCWPLRCLLPCRRAPRMTSDTHKKTATL